MSRKQDGVASVPRWYRWLIIKIYGQLTMDELDRVGGYHDWSIKLFGFWEANKMMRADMKKAGLPYWTVRLPVGRLIGLYRVLPKPLQNLYHYLTK